MLTFVSVFFLLSPLPGGDYDRCMTISINTFGQRLARLLLTPICLACGQVGGQPSDLCQHCQQALPFNRSCCGHCALPLASPALACATCLRRPPVYTKAICAFEYAFPINRLLQRFKFHQDLAAGRLLAEYLLTVVSAADRPQVLIPVPLHWQRLRERGYDQALELAKPLARQLKLPLISHGLTRQHATAAQTQASAAARRRNVRRAFFVNTKQLPSHVALIDDVMTTGATVSECARTLRRAGVERVDVWTVARVRL